MARKNKTRRKVSRAKAPKPRRVYRIGAVSKPSRKPSKMKGSKIMTGVVDAAMTGAGVVAGNFLNGKLMGMIPNPYARSAALVALGVLGSQFMPRVGALANGVAAAGVANAAAQLLPALGPGPAPVQGIGALTQREVRMIEAAAKGEREGVGAMSPQSEVLTGLYDTAGVLA